MLKRLVILNSEIYAKADIDLNDCQNLQIVGPNNIGKSTLIYALNFLYIIDGRQMTFSGNRTGDKTTINHYFPTIPSSYIIFEIFKQRYYCILVKRNAEGSLDYYKIDSDYKEEQYLVPSEQGSLLRKFDELQIQWSTSGVVYRKFQDRRELFNFVYQKGKRNNGVVWLNEGISTDQREISNNFSKIYRYLINSRLIDNRTLKESLIIADNKEGERVEFTKKNQKDIQNLLKHNREIKIIKGIETEFGRFKDLVDEYQARTYRLAEITSAFNHQYVLEHHQLDRDLQDNRLQKERLGAQLKSELEPRRIKLHQGLGGLDKDILQNHAQQDALEQTIIKIKSYPSLSFLEENYRNLDRERREIESSLTQIETQNKSSLEIEEKISELQVDIEKMYHQISTYSNLLIHQVSDNTAHKEILNAILSDRLTSLSKDAIKSKISQLGDQMKLFDGMIQLPHDLEGKPVPSIADLEVRKNRLEKEKFDHERLLPVAKNREKFQRKLEVVQVQIKEVSAQIDAIRSLPEQEIKQKELLKEGKRLVMEKEQSEKELDAIEVQIEDVSSSIDMLTDVIHSTEKRIDKIQGWKARIETVPIESTDFSNDESLDNLYISFENNIRKIDDIKTRKDRLFDQLKNKVESIHSSEEEFIDYVQSELATLDDKRRSIDGLLKNISTQFANPCKTLYSKFEEFESFINNRFNSKIRKIRISDIDALRIEVIPNEYLIGNLKKIMAIRDLTYELVFEDQTSNLEVLNKYLDQQEVIEFEDLFDIKLHLDKNDRHKEVNLKNQIESDGTDKMIRLVIIMSIIAQIAINDIENQIVIFIDEIGTIDEANRIEILRFCRENNFIPISAAPLHPYDGFDKYYLIRRNKGKIIVGDQNSIVIRRNQQVS